MTAYSQRPEWALTDKQRAILQKKRDNQALLTSRNRSKSKKKFYRQKRADRITPFGTLPGEDVVLAEIIRQRAVGHGCFWIADHLNTKKFPARGARWYETSVRRIFEREESLQREALLVNSLNVDVCPPL